MARINADLKPLIDAARKNGYTVVPDGRGKHYKVIYGKQFGAKAGQRVQDEHGPLIVAGTPSEFRDRDLTANRWLKAGVIKRDQVPWWDKPPKAARAGANGDAAPKKASRGSRLGDPDVQAKKVEAIKRIAREQNEKTSRLRARLEPIIVKLGGWRSHGGGGTGVAATELADVAIYFAETRGRVELPKDSLGQPVTRDAARAAAAKLKTPGAALGKRWLPFWELFVDELERDGKPLERWNELVREWKGLPAKVETPEPGPSMSELARPRPKLVRVKRREEEREEPEEKVERPQLGPLYGRKTPTVALKAVAWMAKAAIGEDQMQEVVGIGESILELELKGEA